METWKSIIRKHAVNNYHVCAYLYRNGALVTWRETYKGKEIEFSAWKAQKISFSDETLHRVVLHNASVLAFGIPEKVIGHSQNESENTKKAGLTIHTIELIWSNGAVVRDDEIVGMLSADFHGQGSAEWNQWNNDGGAKEYVPAIDDIIAA
jgi:hypothetical protein